MGDTITLRCRSPEMHLVWQNGLLFYGTVNLTCSTCENWTVNDLPTCRTTIKEDSYLLFNNDMKILRGGIVEIPNRKKVSFQCINFFSQPIWNPNYKKGTYVYSREPVTSKANDYYMEILEISNANELHDGRFDCYYSTDSEFFGPNRLNLKIVESEILCPKLETDTNRGVFHIYYENNRKIHSAAHYVCKSSTQTLIGSSHRTCLENGQWSGSYPSCEDYQSCDRFESSDVLKVFYTNDVKVGSVATFSCPDPYVLFGSDSSTCQQNGVWNYDLPSCEDPRLFNREQAPTCFVRDIFKSLTEGAFVDMNDVQDESVPQGTELQIRCAQNFVLYGNPKVKCASEGRWEIGDISCIEGCVMNQGISPDLLIEPEKEHFYLNGEVVTFSCPEGKRLNSDVQKITCQGTDWSDPIPSCVEVQ